MILASSGDHPWLHASAPPLSDENQSIKMKRSDQKLAPPTRNRYNNVEPASSKFVNLTFSNYRLFLSATGKYILLSFCSLSLKFKS